MILRPELQEGTDRLGVGRSGGAKAQAEDTEGLWSGNNLPVFQEYKGAVWTGRVYNAGEKHKDESREAGRGPQQLPRGSLGFHLVQWKLL